MGPKKTVEGVEHVYAAANTWIERALKADDSLFCRGEKIWTREWLGELRERFLNKPDVEGDGFYDKLRQQLEHSPPEVYQLMAEVLYVQFLIVWKGGMVLKTKRDQVEQVLRWGAFVSSIPEDLINGLTPGVAHSRAFTQHRPYQVGFIIEFAEQWKELYPTQQEGLLNDPWAFRHFVWGIHFRGQLMLDRPHAPSAQREALLHLVHPDTFEGTVSRNQKNEISSAEAFAQYINEETGDVDQELLQIRCGLEGELGGDFDFYDRDAHGVDIRSLWDSAANPWDEFVRQAQAYVDSGTLETDEVSYKREMGLDLARAREAVLAGKTNWHDLLKHALRTRQGHPIAWQLLGDFNRWCTTDPDSALAALCSLWAEDSAPIGDRIRAFAAILSDSGLRGAVGNRTNIASVLLMGVDVDEYPPFRVRVFERAFRRTLYGDPEPGADEGVIYEHALGFLDRFIEEASQRGTPLGNRLEAQSVIWQMGGPEEPCPCPALSGLEQLADDLNLTADFLKNIVRLLEDKGQVVFQGPPGTGKTYVAKVLAEHLAEGEGRVSLVQFHPSYAYEDFIQGFRPILKDGKAGFELTDGPLIRAAKQAAAQPDEKHILVIDEINRGNIAKVFGELYFLLEYRDEKIRLQYQSEGGEHFSLPENLYVIGTMNTADRSIALVDLALRRRFYFVNFRPDEEPIKSVLRNWIRKKAPHMAWVADVVDRANEKLSDDRHAAIGPSYFMREGLNDEEVELVWNHSVLPYMEERLFGEFERLQDFRLSNLRREVIPLRNEVSATNDAYDGLDPDPANEATELA